MDSYDGGSHEANILHAALADVPSDVREGVSEMTRFEKQTLLQAANTIASEAARSLRIQDDDATTGTLIAYRWFGTEPNKVAQCLIRTDMHGWFGYAVYRYDPRDGVVALHRRVQSLGEEGNAVGSFLASSGGEGVQFERAHLGNYWSPELAAIVI